MGKRAVLKFLIYSFYAVSCIFTLLLLMLPYWDNQDPINVGIFLTLKNGDLEFGYMNNIEARESTVFQLTVYTVVYLCIVALLNLAVIGLTSLDSNKVAKWLHVILCCAHATGLVFIFFIYGFRYISQWVPPLKNYYLDIIGILIDFILILLLIMYKRSKKLDDAPMEEIQIDESGLSSRLSSKKSKKDKIGKTDPQFISEGIATPLYVNGAEYVEPQPVVEAKPSVLDPNRIVVSDNIVNNETYIGNNENQFQYNTSPQLEVQTTPATIPVMPQIPMNNQQPFNNVSPILSPGQGPIPGPTKIDSQYTYSESNAYPVTSNTILKIPEVPVIGTSSETIEIPGVPKVDVNKDTLIM
ncbi:hypothetical protein BCR36DRAFT_326099 [Piromyces finnis]|uniref:Uncharacterized protein n=1 Tax=Piromyces finnis TaxID=1754191 RepID=A0A1Y1VA70_9FUNG|nr:hypothetical protein BCR36DRAFT_326099 [Piromyces finnis]|eukprot:ORX51066.1 hypothetical protein BCR36DRAFT_326099 [Piromyces finnis]